MVTRITDMVAQLLFMTVPNTIDTSAMSRGKPRSRSAETTFIARVSYDPPVPKPAGQTEAKYEAICFHDRLLVSFTTIARMNDQLTVVTPTQSVVCAYEDIPLRPNFSGMPTARQP